jgi:hypothetical protein
MVLFYTMGLIGIVDFSYQSIKKTECGPIAKVLSVFSPKAPGAAKCQCAEEAKQSHLKEN